MVKYKYNKIFDNFFNIILKIIEYYFRNIEIIKKILKL